MPSRLAFLTASALGGVPGGLLYIGYSMITDRALRGWSGACVKNLVDIGLAVGTATAVLILINIRDLKSADETPAETKAEDKAS